uniref:Uncharacterized protein n=1 Tax=Rhizophora mucronata TaxID=61149 RepID=A0A2P2NG22_RHIMU
MAQLFGDSSKLLPIFCFS